MNRGVLAFSIGVGERAAVLVLCCFFFTACTDPAVEVPKYAQQLRSSEAKMRAQAALKLGRIGPPHAVPATGELIRLLQDPNPGVKSAAAYALRRLDTPEAQRALAAATR